MALLVEPVLQELLYSAAVAEPICENVGFGYLSTVITSTGDTDRRPKMTFAWVGNCEIVRKVWQTQATSKAVQGTYFDLCPQ